MIQINLLPKNYLKGSRSISLGKVGVYAVVGAVGIVLMLSAITVYQMYQLKDLEESIQKANNRAAVLQNDIKLVDALIDIKRKINERMQAVEKLDRHRSVWVRILEDVARDVPEFVWLGVYKEQQLTKASPEETAGKDAGQTPPSAEASSLPAVRPAEIEGYAFTLNSLASFMINLMRSDYFDEVELVSTNEIKFGTDREKAYNFVLSCNVHYLSDEALQSLIAQADANKSQTSTTHKVLN